MIFDLAHRKNKEGSRSGLPRASGCVPPVFHSFFLRQFRLFSGYPVSLGRLEPSTESVVFALLTLLPSMDAGRRRKPRQAEESKGGAMQKVCTSRRQKQNSRSIPTLFA